jgi:hypothetical protein
MPLRSTERSDGRSRPGWKDGSQRGVGEQVLAVRSADDAITNRSAGKTEESDWLTRDYRRRAEGDAGSQSGSRRGVQMPLDVLPYEKTDKRAGRGTPNYTRTASTKGPTMEINRPAAVRQAPARSRGARLYAVTVVVASARQLCASTPPARSHTAGATTPMCPFRSQTDPG